MFKLDFYRIFAVVIFTSWLLFIFPNVMLAGAPPLRLVHTFVNLLPITQPPQSTFEKVQSVFVQGKEWKFSGIGVYMLSLVMATVCFFIAYLVRKCIRKEQWKQQQISLEDKLLKKKWLNNRRSILNVMKSQINQEMEEVLFKEIVIELDLLKKIDTVEHLRNTVILRKFVSDKPLPPSTKIQKVFDDFGGSMLILGNPGAGKTTCLLELGRELVKRAEQNIDHPIPIIVNVSTWAQKRLPFHEWLAGEIVDYYSVPKKVAFGWIKNDDLLVLLDGLDEVVPHYREACVQAINAYQQDRVTAGSMVVCSRSEEYCVLSSKLEIHGTVELQPLTDSQIDKYFREIGNEIDAVRKMVENDPTVYKLAHVPLMLNLIVLAFHGNPKTILTPTTNVNECRRCVFDTYIHRMLEYPRSEHFSYPADQTKQWLSWLARKMMEHGQTVFLLEKIQLSWIDNISDIRLWRLIYGLISAMILGLTVFVKLLVAFFHNCFIQKEVHFFKPLY